MRKAFKFSTVLRLKRKIDGAKENGIRMCRKVKMTLIEERRIDKLNESLIYMPNEQNRAAILHFIHSQHYQREDSSF